MKAKNSPMRLEGNHITSVSLGLALLVTYTGMLFGWGTFLTFALAFATFGFSWLLIGMLFFVHPQEYEIESRKVVRYEGGAFSDDELDELLSSRLVSRNLMVQMVRVPWVRQMFEIATVAASGIFMIYLWTNGRSFDEMFFLITLFFFTWTLATVRMKARLYPLIQKLQSLAEKPEDEQTRVPLARVK